MKATGIVRKVDELGRLVLPVEMRRVLNIAEKDTIEIYVEGENIILRKFQPYCIFCSGGEDIVQFEGKHVCARCARKLGELI